VRREKPTMGSSRVDPLRDQRRNANFRDVDFYLDTNVYRHVVETGNPSVTELLKKSRARIRVAAVTVLELIEDIATCKNQNKFSERKKAVELARWLGGKKILPADGEFVLRKIFHPGKSLSSQSSIQAKRWLDAVVRYWSVAQLGQPVRHSAWHVFFDFRDVASRLNKMRIEYVEMLDRYKNAIIKNAGLSSVSLHGGSLTGPYREVVNRYFKTEDWKATYVTIHARAVGASRPLPSDLLLLWRRLQTPCEFSTTILRQSICDGYRYDKNANDALDESHLRYLCDDSLVFVTDDAKLRSKISDESRKRVISSADFISVLRET